MITALYWRIVFIGTFDGAYCGFDAASARQLRELLNAVAVFAAGGRLALADYGKRTGGAVLQITKQIG